MKQIKKILKFIIVLACIIYLVRFFYVNRDSLQITFNLSVLTIVYIVLLSIIYLLLHSYRFQLIIEKCSGCKLNFFPWFKILVLSRFLNLVVAQMGNIYRGVRLKQDYSVSYTRYISSFTSMAWMDTCVNLATVTAIVSLLTPGLQIGPFSAKKILLALTLSSVGVPLLIEALLRKMNLKNPYLAWVHSKLSEVLTVTVNNLRDKAYLFKIIILGLLVFITTIPAYYILFLSFNIRLNLSELAVFHALLKLSVFVNITPGNVGVQEIAYGFISEQMGIGMAQGVLVSAVARILYTVLFVLLGLLFGGIDVLRHRKNYAKSAD